MTALRWIDSHCHLDAAQFDPDRDLVRRQARQQGVWHCVLPAVQRANFETVRRLARQHGDSYALGIHPLYTGSALAADLTVLAQALAAQRADPHLVAVGEIGLDAFVPQPGLAQQQAFFQAQLELACQHQLPVILHVRRSADLLLQALRRTSVAGGIAHAFNGSWQQAKAFVDLGFKLGFGGAMTFDRALQLRRLASQLPLEALVLETDAPDIPPHWLYRSAEQRAQGQAQGRNSPAELPRIAQVLAETRGLALPELAQALWRNTLEALPRLRGVLPGDGYDHA